MLKDRAPKDRQSSRRSRLLRVVDVVLVQKRRREDFEWEMRVGWNVNERLSGTVGRAIDLNRPAGVCVRESGGLGEPPPILERRYRSRSTSIGRAHISRLILQGPLERKAAGREHSRIVNRLRE